MYFKKSDPIKFLILTDLNVSNVHYMLAKCLQADSRFEALFLNFNSKPDFHNNVDWFVDKPQDEAFNLSRRFSRYNIIKKVWKTIRLIKESDIVFTSGKVGNLIFLSRKPYIYFSYGSDLDQYAKYGESIFGVEWRDNLPPLQRYYQTYIVNPVRRLLYKLAIRKADITIIAQHQSRDISKLGYKRLGFLIHPLEADFWNITLNDKRNNKKLIQKLYDCERVLFSSTRHVWDSCYAKETDFKGNNIIIETLKLYLEQTGDAKIKLFLVEKGQDVELSKKLIKEHGLEKYAVWLKPMPRRELIRFYSGADVFFDEFGKGCFALCSVEAMACGTPTVSYIGERNSQVPFYPGSPYLLNTKEPRAICNYLIKLFSDNIFKQNEEEKTFKWVRDNCSNKAICDAFFEMVKEINNS